jgi:hypothetical protein
MERVICDGYNSHSSTEPLGNSKSEPEAQYTNIPSSLNKVTCRLHPSPGFTPLSRTFSAHEVPYFDFFLHGLAKDLSGYNCSEFWSRIVPCEAMGNDCVSNAVLAIAALSQGISNEVSSGSTRSKPSALFPWTAKSIVNDHHRVALRYYVQALSLFRKQVDVGVDTRSPRTVFIMTMLLITFELLQGNMEMVDSLMTSSIQLLKESLSQYRQDTSLQDKAVRGRTEEDFNDIEHMLPFLSIMAGWTPFLKGQTRNLGLWETSAVDDVPDLGYRSARELQANWSRFFARTSAFAGQAMTKVLQSCSTDADPELSREQQTYLSLLDKWRDVLDLGLARAVTASNDQAKRAIQLMQLHHLMANITLKCCLDPTDMIWDAYDNEFVILVERCLAFAIETKPAYRARFTLSMGLLSTLGPAIAKCRNHNTRMRALEIARRMPWREGAWDADAELFGKLGAVLLEERGRDANGFISAENRWTWLDGNWNIEKKILYGRYVRSVPDRSGNPVIMWLELGMDEWPDVCGDISCVVDHAAECRALDKHH